MRQRALIVAVALAPFAPLAGLPGCGEEAPKVESPAPPAPEVKLADVVGNWAVEDVCMSNLAFNIVKHQVEERLKEFPGYTITDAQIDDALQPHLRDMQLQPPIATFKDDMTYTIKAGKQTLTGTWSLAGDMVTLQVTEDRQSRYQVMGNYLKNITADESRRPVHFIRK